MAKLSDLRLDAPSLIGVHLANGAETCQQVTAGPGEALRITGSPDTSAVVEHIEFLSAPDHPATEQVAENMSTP